MINKKIINPSTVYWVSCNGIIGKRLIRIGEVHTDTERYKKVRKLWDWWATRDDKNREKVVDSGWWDTSLNDQEEGVYPVYIMSYEKVLKKAYKIVNEL